MAKAASGMGSTKRVDAGPCVATPPPGWQLCLGVDSAKSSVDSPGTADARSVQPTEAVAVSSMAADRRVVLLEAENAALRARLDAIGTDADAVVELNDERVLQDVGIYRYHHPLENAVAYRARLDGVGAHIAELVKAGTAIEKSNMFTFDASLSKGRSFTNDLPRQGHFEGGSGLFA